MKLVRADSSKSRSEEVRTRRTQTGQQRAARTARGVSMPANRPAQPPPVTVRTRSAVVPTAAARGKPRPKPRRQFYYALGSTGAELRLPALPALRPGWRLLSALLTLLLAAGVYFAYTDPLFQVQTVEMTGLKRIKKSEVQKLLGLEGAPIVTFNPTESRALLEETYPELTEISISVALPASISIAVTERQPILAWKKGEKTYWADKEGFLFSPRGEVNNLLTIESDEDPPIAVEDTPLPGETPTPSEAGDKQDEEEIARLKGPLGKKIDPNILSAASTLKKKVNTDSALLYSSKDGLGWNDAAGWRVYVGVDLEDIALKLSVYAAVVERLNRDGIQPAMISVENVHAPFYRME